MKRRTTFLVAAGAVMVATTRRGVAQTGKRRVAYLGLSTPATGGHLIALFIAGLRERGWIEGDNLVLDLRFAQGDATRLPAFTSELLALRPDVFVTTTDFAAGVAARATKTVPIVFLYGSDPVGNGLVKSLAHPGGNVTGFGVLGDELDQKRLSLLKEALPELNKVAVLVDKSDRSQAEFKQLEAASRRIGVLLLPAWIEGPGDIAGAIEAVARSGAKGLMDATAGPMTFVLRDRIAALAIEHRLAMIRDSTAADSAVLLSHGADFASLFKRGATLVDRILKGARPADIPIEQVNTYELVVNMSTARALGIELPRSLMLQATRMIE